MKSIGDWTEPAWTPPITTNKGRSNDGPYGKGKGHSNYGKGKGKIEIPQIASPVYMDGNKLSHAIRRAGPTVWSALWVDGLGQVTTGASKERSNSTE